jgi:hypothetical protein
MELMDAKQMRRKPLDDEGDIAKPDRLEAIAMRRLVAARGYWLSPMHANTPVPKLEGKELLLDISQAHSTAPMVSKFESCLSVLERIDNPGQKRASYPGRSSLSTHDTKVNQKAMANLERLTSSERAAMERTKEERRKAEIEDKARRMREMEAELLPQLSEEDKARNLAKAKRVRAKAAAYQAEQDRLKAKREAAVEAKRGMSPEQRKEEDLRRKREQSRARRAKDKAALEAERALVPAPAPAPVVLEVVAKPAPKVETSKRGRPRVLAPLNLEPTVQLVPAIDEAYATPLHDIIAKCVHERVVAWRIYERKVGRTITEQAEAEARQDIEASIMAKSNEQPDYLYKWMERRIIHTRSAAIIKREKRRGNLDHDTAMQVRAAINPLTAKRLAVAELTPEEQADRRRAKQAEYKRNRRKKGKA